MLNALDLKDCLDDHQPTSWTLPQSSATACSCTFTFGQPDPDPKDWTAWSTGHQAAMLSAL